MKNLKYLIIFLSLIVIGSSCSKDFVDLNSPNQQTNGTFWKTSDDAIAGINAVYMTLYYDGLYMRIFPWEMDVRADDEFNTSPWWSTEVSKYTYTVTDPMVEEPWQYNYIGIFRANQVLTNVPNISMDQSLKNRILGEAKFLRGLFYFHLEILYKNVPIITSLPLGPEDYYPKQSPDSLVWEQIISDFTDAEASLWTKSQYNSSDGGRATKAAAAAFLAKSLMFTKQWGKAAPVLKDIIDQKLGSYSLISNYRENFNITKPNNDESLFEIQFEKSVGGTVLGWVGEPNATWSKTDGYARGIAPLPNFGYGDISPTDWIYQEFLKEKTVDGKLDPRLDASFFYQHFLKAANGDDSLDAKGNKISDPSYTIYGLTWSQANLTLRTGQKYNVHIRKYLNDETDKNEVEWRSGIHRRVMRYSDVLLLYAECLNELGQTNSAYPYIQQVRTRANLPDLATVQPGLSQDGMRTQLAHERALELCFEAQRYFDLLRWGWITDDTKRAILISHDPEFSKWTTGREYFPIPNYEMNTNKNLVQNPGWN